MAELNSAKRARATFQGYLTRYMNKFNLKKDEMDFFALQTMLTSVEELEKKFMTTEEIITRLEGEVGGEIPEEIASSPAYEKFMDDYETLRVNLLALMEVKRPKPEVNTSGAGNNDTLSKTRLFHLPKLQVPRFSGAYTDWIDFKNEFLSIVNDKELTNVERFRFLKTALNDGPKQIISSMEISDQNYDKAWKALVERYDNKALIFRSHINAILSLQGITGASAEQHRQLLDSVRAHYRALSSLGTTENLAENLLICIILQKLDQKSQAKWEEYTDTEIATWDEFVGFYEGYAATLERVHQAKIINSKPGTTNSSNKQQSGKKNHTLFLSGAVNCPFCADSNPSHISRDCPMFLKKTPQERRDSLKGQKICWKCLTSCGKFRKCPSKCGKCGKSHNTLLHIESQTNPDSSGTESDFRTPQSSPIGTSTPNSNQQQVLFVEDSFNDSSLIGSAMVDVFTDSGDRISVHALLDSGSTINVVSERIARMVNAKIYREKSLVGGLGSLTTNMTGHCLLRIGSRFNNETHQIYASTISKICDSYPPTSFDISGWNLPLNCQLANPNFNKSQRVDLLIGAGLFWNLIENERIPTSPELPICQKTKLGWIFVGRIPTPSTKQNFFMKHEKSQDPDESLNELVERFWSMDSFSNNEVQELSSADRYCQDLFESTTRRDPNGRYIVQLPFRPQAPTLGRSDAVAKQRFFNLERRLHKDKNLFQMYSDFVKEYQDLGHLEEATDFSYENPHYFIPHHCVLKMSSSTTKLRVVFDASCKTSNGLSLNDILYPGPKIQEDLFVTLLKFRMFKFVATVDIVKMYRQTLIDPSQRNFQLIYWRENPTDALKILRLRTVTYGTAPGAFLAIRALHQLAQDEKKNFPVGAKLILNHFYVDDGLIGFDTTTELEKGLDELSGILSKGGMSLGKYCSNSREVMKKIPEKLHEKYLRIDEHQIIRTLGLLWEPEEDAFHFCSEDFAPELETKRKVLSKIARIFDPLGLICPIVTLAKVFYQDLWKLKLDWDETLPKELSHKWSDFCTQLAELKNVNIPRYVIGGTDVEYIDLHGFSDASEKAYGACIYLTTSHKDGRTLSHLFCSKSRVAPTKTLSIARLELCAAKLLSDLVARIVNVVLKDQPIRAQYLWTDSQIVLCWLRSEPSRWSSFVSHRVAKIQSLTSEKEWRHIPGENNPADLVSRGMPPKELSQSSLWWNGPSFLSNPREMWPEPFRMNETTKEEARAVKFTLLSTENNDLTSNMHFSTNFRGTRRAFAYVLRFIRNCRNPNRLRIAQPKKIALDYKQIPVPSISDEIEAEEKFLAHIQQVAFPGEYNAVKKGYSMPKDSALRQLSPILQNGIIRVGGRLEKSSLPHDSKHQILLPKDHPYTNQIFFYFHHYRVFHSGAQTTLAAVRTRYWPIRGLVTARKMCYNCVWCFKVKPRFVTQIMGGLPIDRINPKEYRPFNVTGVDFAGPFVVRHHARCKQPKKAYLALFVCFATKAVHVELVNDLSSEAFLRALRRFIADRGVVAKIFSDNATNFKGAANHLMDVKKMLDASEKDIRNTCNGLHIEWSFIPPRMPNYGGLWESAIKSLKKLLVKIGGNLNMTEDELRTFGRQAASVMNSRPITTMSSDVNDLEPLTPSHFIYGSPAVALPEPPSITFDKNINTVHLAQRMAVANRQLWQRFQSEYLSLLQQRTKWLAKTNKLNKDAIVLVKDDSLPPLKWLLGRITEVIPSTDGNTRVVKVKTKTGEMTRGINCVAALPLHGGEDVRGFLRPK